MSQETPSSHPENPTDTPEAKAAGSGPARSGKYSLAEMLRELDLDSDGVAGGTLLDQKRIDAMFRNESKNDRD